MQTESTWYCEQSYLSILTQKYLCKCEDTYFILQNKYLCIHKDSFGGKILRDDCAHNTKKHLLKILQQVTKSAFERSCSCEAANKVHLLCSVKRERWRFEFGVSPSLFGQFQPPFPHSPPTHIVLKIWKSAIWASYTHCFESYNQ